MSYTTTTTKVQHGLDRTQRTRTVCGAPGNIQTVTNVRSHVTCPECKAILRERDYEAWIDQQERFDPVAVREGLL